MVTVIAENLNATLYSLSVKIARWWAAVFWDSSTYMTYLASIRIPGPTQLSVVHRKAGRGLGNEATYMYMYFTYIRVFKVRTCTFSQWSGQTRPARPIQCYGTCSDCGGFTLFCKLRGFNLLYNLMWLDLVHSPTVIKLCTTVSRVLPISRIWSLGEKL